LPRSLRSGQSADANYCQLLADLNRTFDDSPNIDAAVQEAINQCSKGNTAAGIPVLEKALTDDEVTLPPSSVTSSNGGGVSLNKVAPTPAEE
jgi:hypothetical protein